jgi:hypothetical protein
MSARLATTDSVQSCNVTRGYRPIVLSSIRTLHARLCPTSTVSAKIVAILCRNISFPARLFKAHSTSARLASSWLPYSFSLPATLRKCALIRHVCPRLGLPSGPCVTWTRSLQWFPECLSSGSGVSVRRYNMLMQLRVLVSGIFRTSVSRASVFIDCFVGILLGHGFPSGPANTKRVTKDSRSRTNVWALHTSTYCEWHTLNILFLPYQPDYLLDELRNTVVDPVDTAWPLPGWPRSGQRGSWARLTWLRRTI